MRLLLNSPIDTQPSIDSNYDSCKVPSISSKEEEEEEDDDEVSSLDQ